MPHAKKKWSGSVKTDSTHPPEGLFTKDPETIARSLASKRVSPKGPTSGMRMLTFFMGLRKQKRLERVLSKDG
jgi:tRNA(adenine34) deaminase